MTERGLEIFQDLHLRARSAPASIREHVLAEVKAPWRHVPDREEEIKDYGTESMDVVALVREASPEAPAACLVLWQEANGYRVSNIVPIEVGELSIAKYNAILQDFVARIAKPAGSAGNFDVDLSRALQTLDDWLVGPAATALRRFSHLANKSSAASHPMDEERWYEFLILAHRCGARLDVDRLVRWLSEVEDWPIDVAHRLGNDYEFARGILEKYDGSPR